MKCFFRRPSFYLALLLLLAYFCAEIIIRGEALNRISVGVGGYLFWGGVVLLGYCWILLPIIRFVSFPKWIDPETFDKPSDEVSYLEKMGKYYISIFKEKRPDEISGMISELNDVIRSHSLNGSDYRDKLERLVPEIHRILSEVVCDRIIKDFMKKTAVLVCISQRGYLDSIAMLVMQLRMVIDLSRCLGYRPSWFFILNCFVWIIVNSIVFALFDSTEFVEEAVRELLPLIIGESLGNSLPIFGKIIGIAAQGASAMAIVYSTGKIIQLKLTGTQQRLTGKERIQLRVEGYKMAAQMLACKSSK